MYTAYIKNNSFLPAAFCVVVAAFFFGAGCTEKPIGLYTRGTNIQCMDQSCGCKRAISRVLIPADRLPTSQWQDLTPFLAVNSSGHRIHEVADPVVGFSALEFPPTVLNSNFVFRNWYGDALTTNGGIQVFNYFGLITRTIITLQEVPQALIDNPSFPLENRHFQLATFAVRGGAILKVTQGSHVETVGTYTHQDSMFICTNPNTLFYLSSTDPIEVEIQNNFSDGGLTDRPWLSLVLSAKFDGIIGSGANVCNQNVYAPTDPRRPASSIPPALTLADANAAGWFNLHPMALQPHQIDRSQFSLTPCPYNY